MRLRPPPSSPAHNGCLRLHPPATAQHRTHRLISRPLDIPFPLAHVCPPPFVCSTGVASRCASPCCSSFCSIHVAASLPPTEATSDEATTLPSSTWDGDFVPRDAHFRGNNADERARAPRAVLAAPRPTMPSASGSEPLVSRGMPSAHCWKDSHDSSWNEVGTLAKKNEISAQLSPRNVP